MKLKTIMPIILIFLLSACSSAKESAENNIRVQLISVDKDEIVGESLDEGYSGNLTLDTSKANGEKIDFEVGHKVLVYYDGQIEGGEKPTIKEIKFFEITGKATKEEIEEKKKQSENPGKQINTNGSKNNSSEPPVVSKENSKYYSLPLLEAKVNGKTIKLKDNESALIHELVDIVEWEVGVETINSEYVIYNDGVSYEFDSNLGIINNRQDDIHVKLQKELVDVLLLTLNGDL